jgi:hypothetical protein
MEIEAVEPRTGRQIAALTPGRRAPVTELMVRFSKLAAAEIAIRKAAADFALLLQPASDAGKQTAQRRPHPRSSMPNQVQGNPDEAACNRPTF